MTHFGSISCSGQESRYRRPPWGHIIDEFDNDNTGSFLPGSLLISNMKITNQNISAHNPTLFFYYNDCHMLDEYKGLQEYLN